MKNKPFEYRSVKPTPFWSTPCRGEKTAMLEHLKRMSFDVESGGVVPNKIRGK